MDANFAQTKLLPGIIGVSCDVCYLWRAIETTPIIEQTTEISAVGTTAAMILATVNTDPFSKLSGKPFSSTCPEVGC